MKRSHVTLAAVAAAARIAFASGGPPPVQPGDPALDSVVSTATWQARVVAPAHRSDATVDGAVRCARIRAMPAALAVARDEANALAEAAGLRAGRIVGVRRDSAPIGGRRRRRGRQPRRRVPRPAVRARSAHGRGAAAGPHLDVHRARAATRQP